MAEEQQKQRKRYESDMTRKDKMELEKEKLKTLGWKAKAEYIWTYYKLHIAVCIGVILIICYIPKWVDNMKHENTFNCTVINAYSEADVEAEAANFKAFMGDEDEYHDYRIDNSLYFTGDESSDYAMQMKVLTYFAASEIDVMIMPEDIYERYKTREAYMNIKDEVLDAKTYEAVKDYIVEDGDAILITDWPLWQEKGFTYYEPVYLTVIASSKNQGNSLNYIRYLYGMDYCAVETAAVETE